MEKSTFNGQVETIKDWKIIRLPKEVSDPLSSRGMCMGLMSALNTDWVVALEPDGDMGHWFCVPDDLLRKMKTLSIPEEWLIEMQLIELAGGDWLDPVLPADIGQAFDEAGLIPVWTHLTPKAKWAWVRWVRATANAATRVKRIETACSMLSEGKKRPCCFDHSRSTEPHVSKSGVLLDPNDGVH